ncbi:MAG: hypothetical protein JJ934_03315 [Pseudomonadales bacterium]|nr:hypothetical protein [Pseudomonadales bacterium]
MSSETQNQTETPNFETEEGNKPEWIGKQYRIIRVENGLKTRKERIAVGWNRPDGSIALRFSGKQIVENDIYLYPAENDQ